MGYDLYLRRPEGAPALEVPRLEGALGGLAGSARPGGWSLEAGKAQIRAELARSEADLLGINLEVPFGAPESDFRAALLLAAELGAKLQLSLMDPQLGGEIVPNRAEDAVESWKRANRYAIDTAGLVEDVRAALPMEVPPPAIGARGKVMLGLVALAVLLYSVFNWVLSNVTHIAKPID